MSDTSPPADDDRFTEPYDDLLDTDGQPVTPLDLDQVIARLEQQTTVDPPAE